MKKHTHDSVETSKRSDEGHMPEVNQETGLIEEGKLNELVHIITKRPNGSVRIQTDYRYAPSMTDQSQANETDLNYLIKKFKPDELGAYIAARGAKKQEIKSHDFSVEPSLTEARNITYKLKKAFDELPDNVKYSFRNHVEFLKFIENPNNQEKMVNLGLLTKTQIQQNTIPKPNDDLNDKQKLDGKTNTIQIKQPEAKT